MKYFFALVGILGFMILSPRITISPVSTVIPDNTKTIRVEQMPKIALTSYSKPSTVSLIPQQVQATVSTQNVDSTASQSVVGGSPQELMNQAGIPSNEQIYAMQLITRESGWNANAVNPSSGACGLAQELPCGKSGCGVGNALCELEWANSYVIARYGSWANAWNNEVTLGWY